MNFKIDPTEFAGKHVLISGGTKGVGRATVGHMKHAAIVANFLLAPESSISCSLSLLKWRFSS